MTLGKTFSLSGSHLASVYNRRERALANIMGLYFKAQGSNIYEKDLERVEYQIKCLVRLYDHWEVWELGNSSELRWMVKGSRGKNSKDTIEMEIFPCETERLRAMSPACELVLLRLS